MRINRCSFIPIKMKNTNLLMLKHNLKDQLYSMGQPSITHRIIPHLYISTPVNLTNLAPNGLTNAFRTSVSVSILPKNVSPPFPWLTLVDEGTLSQFTPSLLTDKEYTVTQWTQLPEPFVTRAVMIRVRPKSTWIQSPRAVVAAHQPVLSCIRLRAGPWFGYSKKYKKSDSCVHKGYFSWS